LANLNAEAEYIARDNPAAATRVVKSILAAVERLAEYPAMGHPGRVPGTRELIVSRTPYIIPYRVRGDVVELLRVFHAAVNGRHTLEATARRVFVAGPG
jgi:addiction module RelE/StbE family toxin